MSFFGVEKCKIQEIKIHPNADRLELGKVHGLDFQFVVQKDSYREGDLVLYFPVDSLIPQNIIDAFGLAHLTGKDHNRVKTVKLRGEYSQGMVLPFQGFVDKGFLEADCPYEVSEILGVTKYEPEPIITCSGELIALPDGLSKYDIEGYERFPQDTELLLSLPCVVMEKLEGTNFCVHVTKEEVMVCQRQYRIKERDDNAYWHTAKNQGIIDFAQKILNEHSANSVTVYGELCGTSIQGNYYKLSNKRVYVFDIKINREYVGYQQFRELTQQHGVVTVPTLTLSESPFCMTTLSNGKSMINPDVLREGIVVKPLEEQRGVELYRLILKKRSPEYLAKGEK